jgi:hypothetical protein
MRITKRQLRRIIKEERVRILRESIDLNDKWTKEALALALSAGIDEASDFVNSDNYPESHEGAELAQTKMFDIARALGLNIDTAWHNVGSFGLEEDEGEYDIMPPGYTD